MNNIYQLSWSVINPETWEVEATEECAYNADTSLGAYLFAEYKAKQMLNEDFPQYVESAKEAAMELVTEAEEWGQALDEDSILSENLLEYLDIKVEENVY
jgi:hypothetical protein